MKKSVSCSGKKDRVYTTSIWILAVLIIISLGVLVWRVVKQRDTVQPQQTAEVTFDSELSLQWTMQDTEFAGKVDRDETGIYRLTFSKPEEVSGMQLVYDPEKEECTAEFMGMSLNLADQSMLSKHAGKVIGSVLDDVLNGHGVKHTGGGMLTEIAGSIAQQPYTLVLDEKNRPSRLSVPNLGLDVVFLKDDV